MISQQGGVFWAIFQTTTSGHTYRKAVYQALAIQDPATSLYYIDGMNVGVNLSQLGLDGNVSFVQTKFARLLSTKFGEHLVGGSLEFVFLVPELGSILSNSNLNSSQKTVQVATAAGSAAVGYSATVYLTSSLASGPVFVAGVAVGIVTYFGFEYTIKPTISYFAVDVFQRRDPFREYLDLSPYRGGQ